MIDNDLLSQLKSVFGSLEGEIELAVSESPHEKQQELMGMLNDVASTSGKIKVSPTGQRSDTPFFELKHNGKSVGIRFSGIPGGHEFTSLVLAILNADGKGKLPDEMIRNRIRRLKGPIDLRTYISLSCENCPDVVQALNLVALYHPELSHEMADGAFFQDEVNELGIQGVPSVIHEKTLVNSGKSDLLKLLTKLEELFGSNPLEERANVDLGTFDVAVIGGGPAGASAAIYSVRKGLDTVLVAEKFGGQVQETKGIENLISVPYTEGPELAARLMEHVSQYNVRMIEHRRLKGVGGEEVKEIALDSGETLRARALIVATGAKWREMNIPGEKEYLGRGVAFCPHCDGPFYKGKDIAVIGGGNSGVEAAIDLAGIVKSVIVFELLPELKADRVLVDKLAGLPNVSVVKQARTLEVLGDGEKVTGLKYEDVGTGEEKKQDLDGIFVQIGLIPNSECIKGTVETNRFGEIIVDEKCRTSVKGIYAAGDVTTVPYKQIVISMGEGAKAALTAFEEQVLLS